MYNVKCVLAEVHTGAPTRAVMKLLYLQYLTNMSELASHGYAYTKKEEL